MEDIITILIVGAVIVFKIFEGTKKSADATIPTPQKPIVDWEEEASDIEEECTKDFPKAKNKIEQILAMQGQLYTPQPEQRVKPMTRQPMQSPASANPIKSNNSTPRKESSIARELHSAQGARRAFIYSEIFNRKY